MSIFATKSIEQIETEQLGTGEAGGLKRVLGPAQLIMLIFLQTSIRRE